MLAYKYGRHTAPSRHFGTHHQMAHNVKWPAKRSASSGGCGRRQRLLQLWRNHPLRAAITNTFWEYTERTKVSGMWLLRRNRTHGLSR